MNDTSKTELFESYPIGKAVAKLSVPTVLGTLVALLYSLADTYFVGLLNIPAETAAVTLIGPVILAFNAVNNLFGVGSSSMMSRALGRKDYDTLKGSSAFGIYGAALSGVLFSLICTVFKAPLLDLLGTDGTTLDAASSYMFWTVTLGAVPSILNVVLSNQVRAEGAAFPAAIGVMGGCILNILLDPVFILPWGFDLKAEGAAIATCISNVCACLYFVLYLVKNKKNTYITASPKYFIPKKHVASGVCGVGVPASVQNILNVTGTVLLNVLATPFGAGAVAAIGICHKIAMVPMYISMGVTQGVMPFISYNYASGNRKRMKDCVLYTGRITIVILLICSALMLLVPDVLMRFFINDGATVSYGTVMLRGFGLGVTFLAVDFLAVGVFQAIGKGLYAFVFAVLRKLVLEIPLLLLLNRIWPLYGLSFAQTGSELVLAVLGVIMLLKIFKEGGEETQPKT